MKVAKRIRRWFLRRPGDERRRQARLADPEVRERNLLIMKEREAGKPTRPGISAEDLPDYLREHG